MPSAFISKDRTPHHEEKQSLCRVQSWRREEAIFFQILSSSRRNSVIFLPTGKISRDAMRSWFLPLYVKDLHLTLLGV